MLHLVCHADFDARRLDAGAADGDAPSRAQQSDALDHFSRAKELGHHSSDSHGTCQIMVLHGPGAAWLGL